MYTYSTEQVDHKPHAVMPAFPATTLAEKPIVLPIVATLCRRLAEAEISYCHWKSNDVLERSASGENDLDLLVSRTDAERFTAILHDLGFKAAHETHPWGMPGILDYYGYDETADRLVHAHIHYQLICQISMFRPHPHKGLLLCCFLNLFVQRWKHWRLIPD